MSDVASAAAALRAGRSEEALSLARMALRHSRADEDLAELARLAADLDDPGLIAAVTVRRLRTDGHELPIVRRPALSSQSASDGGSAGRSS